MLTDTVLLAIVVVTVLLAAFIYQIVTTAVAAVDAPTLAKSAAAQASPAAALPARPGQAPAFPARGGQGRHDGPATRPVSRAAGPRTSRRQRPLGVAALGMAGLAAGVVGGWLFLRTVNTAAACSHQAIQICSQGLVVLTGTQLSGAAIAVAGIVFVVIASVLALR